MEQSKLISGVIARLKVAYPYYFKDLQNEEVFSLIAMYQEELNIYSELTITNAVKAIIRESKFMPTLKELLDKCELVKENRKNIIIEKMIADGYFKNPMEIDKTYQFLEKGIIPHWLIEDMKKYGYVEEKTITNKNDDIKLISSV